ncbi:MAG: hypothetical protein AAGH65_09590 [Pseudomonadota bacterium]
MFAKLFYCVFMALALSAVQTVQARSIDPHDHNPTALFETESGRLDLNHSRAVQTPKGESYVLSMTFRSSTGSTLDFVSTALTDSAFINFSIGNSGVTIHSDQKGRWITEGIFRPKPGIDPHVLAETGVPIDMFTDYFELSHSDEDLEILAEFLAFNDEVSQQYIGLFSDEVDQQDFTNALMANCREHLGLDYKYSITVAASDRGVLDCAGALLGLAGSSLAAFLSSSDCRNCGLSRGRNRVACQACGAVFFDGSSALIGAITSCFDDDDQQTPPPPNPPPVPSGGFPDPPLPFLDPGTGYIIVPIYRQITTQVCVEDFCWTEVMYIIVGWQLIEP